MVGHQVYAYSKYVSAKDSWRIGGGRSYAAAAAPAGEGRGKAAELVRDAQVDWHCEEAGVWMCAA